MKAPCFKSVMRLTFSLLVRPLLLWSYSKLGYLITVYLQVLERISGMRDVAMGVTSQFSLSESSSYCIN
jgi:hypothetical protein